MRSRPNTGKYLVRNKFIVVCLFVVDFILELFNKRKPNLPIQQPKKILICNGAHLGDLVLATSVLPILKAAFPNAEIGVLIGSWGKPIFTNHPMVSRIHILDHWFLNRSSQGFLTKLKRYFSTMAQAISEIKKIKYDVVIDLYPFLGNAVFSLWITNIPFRIGYTSAGLGALLTHPVEWNSSNKHVVDYHMDLLKFLPISNELFNVRTLVLANGLRKTKKYREFIDPQYFEREHIVFHMGTGAHNRKWPIEKWRQLLSYFQDMNYNLLFTGSGECESAEIEEVIQKQKKCYNLSNRLTWDEYIECIGDAKLLFGVESLAGHLAAALSIPSVLIYSGITNTYHWRPLSESALVMTSTLPCAPCYCKRGCATMECIKNISAKEVFEEGMKQLSKSN